MPAKGIKKEMIIIITDTLATGNLSISAESPGSAAEKTGEMKTAKYSQLTAAYTFVPMAFETFGPINSEGGDFIQGIGSRIRA